MLRQLAMLLVILPVKECRSSDVWMDRRIARVPVWRATGEICLSSIFTTDVLCLHDHTLSECRQEIDM